MSTKAVISPVQHSAALSLKWTVFCDLGTDYLNNFRLHLDGPGFQLSTSSPPEETFKVNVTFSLYT
jgi:hypothetical protein